MEIPLNDTRLSALAGRQVFERGAAYYDGGAVVECLPVTEGVEAMVAGGALYHVSLWSEAGRFYWECNCPMGEQGRFCKHAVAAGLAWWRPELTPLKSAEAKLEDALCWLSCNEADHKVWIARIRGALDDLASVGQYQTVTKLTAHTLATLARTYWVASGDENTAIQQRERIISLLCHRQAAAHRQSGHALTQAAAYALQQQLAWVGAGGVGCEAAVTMAYASTYGSAWQDSYAQLVQTQAVKIAALERGELNLTKQRQLAWLLQQQGIREETAA